MTAQDFKVPVGEVDVKLPDRDLTAAGEDDIRMTLTDCSLTGDFLNSTTNIRACKRSTQGGFGKFHDTLIGSMAGPGGPATPPPPGSKAPVGLPAGMKDLECPKNLGLTLANTHITGVISSATQQYRDGLTLIDESNRLEMANITQTPAPTVNNGVIVTLDGKSTWTVTGTSYITRLDLADGAKVQAPAGRTLTVTLDGQPLELGPGSYSGALQLTVS